MQLASPNSLFCLGSAPEIWPVMSCPHRRFWTKKNYDISFSWSMGYFCGSSFARGTMAGTCWMHHPEGMQQWVWGGVCNTRTGIPACPSCCSSQSDPAVGHLDSSMWDFGGDSLQVSQTVHWSSHAPISGAANVTFSKITPLSSSWSSGKPLVFQAPSLNK